MGLGNYTFANGTQPFGTGSLTCLNIPIIDDQFVEKTERLVICIYSTQPAVLNNCTIVDIEDNDGMIHDSDVTA